MMSRGIGEKIVNSERKQGISIVWDGDGKIFLRKWEKSEQNEGCRELDSNSPRDSPICG